MLVNNVGRVRTGLHVILVLDTQLTLQIIRSALAHADDVVSSTFQKAGGFGVLFESLKMLVFTRRLKWTR